MSVNKYIPHVLVLPEDDANRNIVNGFIRHESFTDRSVIQVLPSAGGWLKARDKFSSDHIKKMKKNSKRHFVFLIDFDQDSKRFKEMASVVPKDLAGRVFVIGVWSKPEELSQKELGSRECVGYRIADECFHDTNKENSLWQHSLLQHNDAELKRMTKILKPILFPGTH
ncbi:MAG: hypothetical protein GKR94_24480 [Gammaproteobacteria bacterium]|nr:hypothetical protein [Gammaproteobacteria bacterium]